MPYIKIRMLFLINSKKYSYKYRLIKQLYKYYNVKCKNKANLLILAIILKINMLKKVI